MSNARLIGRLERTLARYERGEVVASEVEQSVNLHVPALEQIGTRERNEAGHLAARLINADLSNPPVEFNGQVLTFEGDESVVEVVQDFRAFLARLPR